MLRMGEDAARHVRPTMADAAAWSLSVYSGSVNQGFLDRLIHAEATTARLALVTFEKAAARLPQAQLLKAEN